MSQSSGKQRAKEKKDLAVAKNSWFVSLEAPLDEETYLWRHCLYAYSATLKKYTYRLEFVKVKHAFTKKTAKGLIQVIN